MVRKRSSRPVNNDEPSGSESTKPSGSGPDSMVMVIPKPIEEYSPNPKSSPNHNESEGSIKKARVDKTPISNRLWSEQDKIGILQGLIDFKLQKGEDPYSDFSAFHEFIKDSINVHVSKRQLRDKIRRLKNKYLINADIESVVVLKPHEDKLFQLSKKIWGNGGTVSVRKDRNVVDHGANGKVDVAENGVEEDRNVIDNGVNGKVDVVENGVEVDEGSDEEDEGKDKADQNVVDNVMNGKVDVAENGVEEDQGKDRNVIDNGVNGKVDVVENGVEVDEESDEEDEGKDKEDQNVVDNGANRKVDVAENGVEVDDNKESDEDEEDEDEGKDKEDRNVVDSGANGKVGVMMEDVVENGVEVDKEESDEEDEWKDFREMYPYLSRAWESDVSCSELLKSFIMDNIRLVGSVKLREMDKQWKNSYVEQLKLYVKRLDLQKEQAQTMLDQMTTPDS